MGGVRLDQLLTHAKDSGITVPEILRRAQAAGIPPSQLPDIARIYANARTPKPGHLDSKPPEKHTIWAIHKGTGYDLRTVWDAVGDSMWGEGAMFRGPQDERIAELAGGWYDLDPERFGLWNQFGAILRRDQRNTEAAHDLRAARTRIAELEANLAGLAAAPAAKARKRAPGRGATQLDFSGGRS